jgi:hypothetical protein
MSLVILNPIQERSWVVWENKDHFCTTQMDNTLLGPVFYPIYFRRTVQTALIFNATDLNSICNFLHNMEFILEFLKFIRLIRNASKYDRKFLRHFPD